FAQPQLADLIYPKPAFSEAERNAQQQALNVTEVAQPAMGMINMAAFDVLTSFGLQPDFLAGHSYGEYSALCAAGAISREALLQLSLARGRLAAQAPAGAMAAIDVDGVRAAAAIARHGLAVRVANLNAPDQTIIAGTADAVEAAMAPLAQEGMRVKRLAVGTAFHCDHMAAVGKALGAELAKVAFGAPRIPVYSNLTAARYPADGDEVRAVLARHIAEPVRFAEQIDALYQAGARVFIECGPGLVLTGLTARILGNRPHTLLSIDAPGRDGWVQLAQLLSQAVAAGLALNLEPWFAGRGLAEHSLDEVFAHAIKRTEHGPLIWRVNGGRAMPWAAPAPTRRQAPVSAVAPAIASVPAAAAPTAGDAPLEPVDPPIHYRRTTMNMEPVLPDELPLNEGAATAAPETEFMQIQDGVARLLDFQAEQQYSLRHFLDFQAQLAGMAVSRPPPPVGRMPRPAPRPQPRPLAAADSMPAGAPQAMPAQAIAAPVAPPAQGKAVRPPTLPALPTSAQPIAPRQDHVNAPEPSGGAGAAPASAEEFSAELLKAVSERTGYPVDMLDMDAHMEADLGIDSIKRIEIFSGLTQRHSLVGDRDEEKMIEDLAGFKSLREVVAWYAQLLVPVDAMVAGGPSPKKARTPLPRQDEEVESADLSAQSDPVRCYVVQASSAGFADAAEPVAWAARFPVLLVGQPCPLAAALREQLLAAGHVVRQLVPGRFTRALDEWRIELDLSSEESLLPLAALLGADGEPVGALLNLMGRDGNAGAPCDHRHDARALFLLLKLFAADLKRSAAGGAGRLVNLTAFDGRFGLDGPSTLAVGSAGTLGVAKSAAREWPEVRVKCIDAAPELDPAWLAAQVLREMFSAEPETEVGYSAQGRCRIDLAPRITARHDLSDLALGSDAVVLVTGGAYGITADLALLLAEKYHPHMVLAGRSALPGDEDGLTRGVADPAELRRLLTARLRTRQQKVTPVQVDAELKNVLKDRQIRATLAAIRAAGSTLEYHAVDVRGSTAFGALIDDVYARLGRIDGVLHGAGVISDKLIASKPLASFD
ncbi:MAG: erythronolide synthase, partial [Massilia sp.]|nr:erythronolide synthase [Massilia sp.]